MGFLRLMIECLCVLLVNPWVLCWVKTGVVSVLHSNFYAARLVVFIWYCRSSHHPTNVRPDWERYVTTHPSSTGVMAFNGWP